MASRGDSAPGVKVLIPIDWSNNAKKAFDWYVDTLLQRESTMLYLVHNIEASSEEDLRRKQLGVHTLQEDYETKLIELGASYEWIMGTGNSPGELLVRVAKERSVDLVVMGARGMGKIKKAILGSVSDYVMKKTKIPVLICKWG